MFKNERHSHFQNRRTTFTWLRKQKPFHPREWIFVEKSMGAALFCSDGANYVWRCVAICRPRYINILIWLRGFSVILYMILSFFCLSIPKGDSDAKKTIAHTEIFSESVGAMLGLLYWKWPILIRNNFECFYSRRIHWWMQS